MQSIYIAEVNYSQKKILILVPSFSAKGGIVNYFKALENKFQVNVEYSIRGAKNWPYRGNPLSEILRSYNEVREVNKKLKSGDYSLIQTNTSLGCYSVIRDGIFLMLAHRKKIKTLVFFRGWDEKFERNLRGIRFHLFKYVFFRASLIIVLSNSFKIKLEKWGYKGEIIIETTIVDEKLIAGFEKENLLQKLLHMEPDKFNLLFLARTEKKKGIYETIDAFEILHNQFPNLSLTIAGDGFELESAKTYVRKINDHNIIFKGFITGVEKTNTFKNADLFIFPSYTEGMPNSVLEAMAFGIPVITTSVGGLADFFRDRIHGSVIQNNNGAEIANLCIELIEDKKRYTEIAKRNFEFARSRFTNIQVVNRLEKIYISLLEN